jgi:hypothetical protein
LSTDLEQRVLAFINGGPGDFESLALEVFAFQCKHNVIYRAYCDRQPPVKIWQQIPAVPTSAFKDFALTCFPVEQTVAEFHTSGTTRPTTGRHFFKTLALYDAAITPNFAAHLLPDSARLPILSLVPDDPHSSLAHMARVLIREFGGAFVERLEPLTRPVCVLGTAFHFLSLFDQAITLRLPAGSRAMETGGFKGRTREIAKADLYKLVENHLGIPPTHVVNEYGMTELSTQFYDDRPGSDVKDVPHWSRVLIIDPATGKAARPGVRGLIRVFDLANLWSAMCIQTEDLGIGYEDGRFVVLGRAAGAEVRGCSLKAESLQAK